VLADRIQIQQVLMNLIRNGAEAMENADSPDKRLDVRSQCTDECIIVEVCDYGPGVTHPENVFEPFYSTKQNGLGVGLAISRSIVQAHGGAVQVRDNQRGGGAAAAFALLHGASNGILTIARGMLPLAIFGPENYAYRLGLIGAPSRICQALAPVTFGLLIEPMGRAVVVVSAGMSLASLFALMLLRQTKTAEAIAHAAE
jgi:hypothetical protein